MAFSIALNFNGNCKEAVSYYAKVFEQAPPTFATYGDMDRSFEPNVKMSEGGRQKIAHVQLNIGGTTLSFSDMPDNFDFIQGNNLALCVSFDRFEQAEKAFIQLSEGGSIFVPLAKEAPDYSLLADKFDLVWNISVAG